MVKIRGQLLYGCFVALYQYFGHKHDKVNQRWKMVDSAVSLNIAQNDSKLALIVISSDILTHFNQKVD